MTTTGTYEIKKAAADYAGREMGRRATVVAVLDRGAYAMALLRARDDEDDFALVLVASIASHEWGVLEETNVDDFRRNDERADERCYVCGGVPCGCDPEAPPDDTPDQCYECGAYNVAGEEWPTRTVDLDPGDPEVGPAPDIQEVRFCFACDQKEARR